MKVLFRRMKSSECLFVIQGLAFERVFFFCREGSRWSLLVQASIEFKHGVLPQQVEFFCGQSFYTLSVFL